MKDQLFEARADTQHQTEEDGTYDQYQKLGGVINEKDCIIALERAEKTTVFSEPLIGQAENIAKYAGIALDNSSGVDPKVKLYAVLRAYAKPEDAKNHHSKMSDQRLFAEAVRMLGDIDSLNKMIAAYPNIDF
ncbi:MAG: hypothetical protein A2934_04505 [Candidatus Sungbacteria bacterium RIFCSPLOWO2_01_FULL_47_10]|uniref:Uncharacterized protein n=1 Tax=Candidatus Sungbacteria bacterium RIFCSPLOWO2_01_FULL_47_10 TaxID=1802276 RepID=A0A1G2L2N5_9BACT|nr:MAG: hypothetical protein A2934_04505 [Candidatus Sungbacteria bacterium RIFCSPLOWO2_01_FULL_47_10]